MTTIHSPDHLLQHVARKGDPSAFYTIVAPRALETYQAIRNSGKNHKETMLLLVPFLKILYRGYSRKSDDEDFVSWYRNKQKKHLGNSYDPANESSEEISFEGISEADISHLDSQMKLLFMRNYNRVRARKKSPFKTLVESLRSHAMLRWAAGLLLFLIACAIAYFCLISAHIQITVSIASNSFQHSIRLPFSKNLPVFSKNSQTPGQTQSQGLAADSLPHAMPIIKKPADTVRTIIAIKKHSTFPTLSPNDLPSVPGKTSFSAVSDIQAVHQKTEKSPDRTETAQSVKNLPDNNKTDTSPVEQKKHAVSLPASQDAPVLSH